MTIRELVRPLPFVRRASLLRQRLAYKDSAYFWEQRYAQGRTSGPGSYGALAEGSGNREFEGEPCLSTAATDVREVGPGIKVNVGCGTTPTPGWVNFDNSISVRLACIPGISGGLARLRFIGPGSACLAEMARQGKVRFANAATRIPCPSGSASAVYSSHMIEHLDRREARAFLAEVRRVLRPGGIARLAVPDLFQLVSGYLTSGDADEFVASTHMGLVRPAGPRAWAKWVLAGPRHHLWMYDGDSLIRLLREAGFTDASVEPPGVTRITEPGELDLWERMTESVYVEAVRP